MEPTDLQPLTCRPRDDDWLAWVTERAPDRAVRPRAPRWPRSRWRTRRRAHPAAVERRQDRARQRVRGQLADVRRCIPTPPSSRRRRASRSRRGGSAPTCYLDADVFAQLSSLDEDRLDAGARRVLDDALRDFRRAGVDRDDETRERLRELNRRESELAQAFSRDIRDGRRTTAGAGRRARRACPRTSSRSTRRRRRAGRDQHRVPRHAPVPHPRPRPRAAPRGSRTPSSTSPGPTTTPCSPSCSRCARRRPRCSATPTGRATTPRSR